MGSLTRMLQSLSTSAPTIDREALLEQLRQLDATPRPEFGPEVCEGCEAAKRNREARERWEYGQSHQRHNAINWLRGVGRPAILVSFGAWLQEEYELIRHRPEAWLGVDWTETRRQAVVAVFGAVGRESGEMWSMSLAEMQVRIAEMQRRIVATRVGAFTVSPATAAQTSSRAPAERRGMRLKEVAGP